MVRNQIDGAGIKGRLLKGGYAQGLAQIVNILIRLFEVPLLLSFWGPQLYGEWLMLSAIPEYLSIGDGGFAGAACRDMTMRSGAGDRNGQLCVFQSTWLLLICISLVAGLVTAAFIQVTPFEKWLGFSVIKNEEIKVCLILFVAYVIVGFQGGLLNSGFWVNGQYSNSMYYTAVTRLMEFVGLAVAVVFGENPVHAVFGLLGGRILGTGFMWFGQRRTSPWLKHGFALASVEEIKRLTVPAVTSLAIPLGNALNIQGVRLVVGLALGPAAVAAFVPMRTLSRTVMQPGAIISRLIQPELALSHGAGDSFLFKNIFTKSCQLAIWSSLGISVVIIPATYWIFPIWTGKMVSLHVPAYAVLLSAVIVNSIWQTALMVPYAINRHSSIAIYYIFLYGFTALGLGYIWSAQLGLVGASLAILLAEAAMALVVIHESLKIANISMVDWIKSIQRPPSSLLGTLSTHLKSNNDSVE